MSDELQVAVGRTLDRHDRCVSCNVGMLYRVDRAERITASFCGSYDCPAFLLEIPEGR